MFSVYLFVNPCLFLHLLQDYKDCIRGVVPALLTVVMQEYDKGAPSASTSSTMQLVGIFKSFLDTGKWGYTMLRSLIQDETEEMCILESVLEFVLLKGSGHVMYSSFRLLMQMLYDVDLVSEEVLLEWSQTVEGVQEGQEVEGGYEEEGGQRRHPGVTAEARRALMLTPQLQEFFVWLQEEEEEDSDEDDDEDSD